MAGIKWWRRVIFYAELNSSGRSLACDFGNDAKPKIDACGHTTRRNDVAIFHRSCVFVCGSDERQKIGIGQCVVARLPFSRPATPKANAPMQTEVTYFAALAF